MYIIYSKKFLFASSLLWNFYPLICLLTSLLALVRIHSTLKQSGVLHHTQCLFFTSKPYKLIAITASSRNIYLTNFSKNVELEGHREGNPFYLQEDQITSTIVPHGRLQVSRKTSQCRWSAKHFVYILGPPVGDPVTYDEH